MATMRDDTIDYPKVASRIAVSFLLLVASIQVGIAIGLVSPNITWKASYEVWSWQLAGLSVLAAAILSIFAWVVHQKTSRVAVFGIAAYMTLNTVGNMMSENDFERYGFGSITAVIALCCIVVGCSMSSNPSTLTQTGDYSTIP